MERVDDLQINGYKLIQDTGLFCFGLDAVLLSGFAKVNKGENTLDLGTGNGILPVLLEAKTSGRHFTGLEIQRESVILANRNVALNMLNDKITVVEGDIKQAHILFEPACFDVVVSNPPYIPCGTALQNQSAARAAARHELLCSLNDVYFAASRLLKFGGRFYMVHRPQRICDIITLGRKHRLEVKRLRFVHSLAENPAMLVLAEFGSGRNAECRVLPPLVIYEAKGVYSREYNEIYALHASK